MIADNVIFVVQMQRIDGTWFDLHDGVFDNVTAAKRKAQARRRKNLAKLALRNCRTRVQVRTVAWESE